MASHEDLYEETVTTYGPALGRLARAYEADPETRRDLLQEIHLALWRSFETFGEHCSLRTWIYRVAHNTAASHVMRRMKLKTLVSLEEMGELDQLVAKYDADLSLERNEILDQLYGMIQRLNPLDRQVILLYLEGMDATSIGEMTGISARYTATKIHRIKAILTRNFHKGVSNGQR